MTVEQQIRSELARPVDSEEAAYFGCQSADDLARPLLARVYAILDGLDPRDYRQEKRRRGKRWSVVGEQENGRKVRVRVGGLWLTGHVYAPPVLAQRAGARVVVGNAVYQPHIQAEFEFVEDETVGG